MDWSKIPAWIMNVVAGVLMGAAMNLSGPFVWLLAAGSLVILWDLFYQHRAFPSFLFLLTFWGMGLFWLSHVTGPIEQILISYLGSVLGCVLIYFVVLQVGKRTLHLYEKQGHWFLIITWLFIEFLQGNWELQFPWMRLGYVFADAPFLLAFFKHTGPLGGTLFLWLFSWVVYQVYRKQPWKTLVPYLSCLVLLIISGFWGKSISNPEPFVARIVQPNEDPYSEKYYGKLDVKAVQMWDWVQSQSMDKVNLLLFPETAFQERGMWEDKWNRTNTFAGGMQLKQNNPGVDVVLGTSSYRILQENEPRSFASRKLRGGEQYYESYNTAALVRSSGEHAVYHKSKLVAGVETLPFMDALPFLKDWSMDFGGAVGSLGSQDSVSLFRGKSAVYAPVICYESVFPEYVREFVLKGATLITAMTNDAWWGNSNGHRQHWARAKVLAATLGTPVVRSANTGNSGVLDCNGREIFKSKYQEKGFYDVQVPLTRCQGLYLLLGDWIAWIASKLFILSLIGAFVFKIKSSRIFQNT